MIIGQFFTHNRPIYDNVVLYGRCMCHATIAARVSPSSWATKEECLSTDRTPTSNQRYIPPSLLFPFCGSTTDLLKYRATGLLSFLNNLQENDYNLFVMKSTADHYWPQYGSVSFRRTTHNHLIVLTVVFSWAGAPTVATLYRVVPCAWCIWAVQ